MIIYKVAQILEIKMHVYLLLDVFMIQYIITVIQKHLVIILTMSHVLIFRISGFVEIIRNAIGIGEVIPV